MLRRIIDTVSRCLLCADSTERWREDEEESMSGESGRVNIIRNFGYNLAAGDTDPCTDLTRPRRTDHHTGLQLAAPPSWTLPRSRRTENCSTLERPAISKKILPRGTRKERHILGVFVSSSDVSWDPRPICPQRAVCRQRCHPGLCIVSG